MPKYSFFVSPEGKLPSSIASTLTARLKELAGLKACISLDAAKDKRSLDSNAFYWSAVIPLVRQFRLDQGDACSVDDAHEDLLSVYSPMVERKALDGSVKLTPMRSSAMSVSEFHQYILRIEVALNEFGLYFPAHNLDFRQ